MVPTKRFLGTLLVLAFSAAALLPSARATASSTAAGAQRGPAVGKLATPAISGMGFIEGQMHTSTGEAYTCSGKLFPLSFPIMYFGIMRGTLTPVPGSGGLTGIKFHGSWVINPSGVGTFRTQLALANPIGSMPPILLGAFTGQFKDAGQLDPASLLPSPGEFWGIWRLK